MTSLLNRVLRRVGLSVHRFRPVVFPDAQLSALLRSRGVNLVLDVGANVGQYGATLRQNGYTERIVSFEPLLAARRALLAASAGDPLWEVGERAALGERDGEIDIHVSANSVSSSALDILDAHLRSAPESRYVDSERVPLRRLDAIGAGCLRPDSVTLLKIDTQGYEDRVLDGAAGILSRVAGVQLELSLVPLYAGQKLLPEMLERLRGLGFSLWAIWPAFVEPGSARTLQVDATLFRDPAPAALPGPSR
jgi:FkbM family methyltransferase